MENCLGLRVSNNEKRYETTQKAFQLDSPAIYNPVKLFGQVPSITRYSYFFRQGLQHHLAPHGINHATEVWSDAGHSRILPDWQNPNAAHCESNEEAVLTISWLCKDVKETEKSKKYQKSYESIAVAVLKPFLSRCLSMLRTMAASTQSGDKMSSVSKDSSCFPSFLHTAHQHDKYCRRGNTF